MHLYFFILKPCAKLFEIVSSINAKKYCMAMYFLALILLLSVVY
jgi:hypothetical protein